MRSNAMTVIETQSWEHQEGRYRKMEENSAAGLARHLAALLVL